VNNVIEAKVNQFRKLATAPKTHAPGTVNEPHQKNDSLLHVIRSPKEAIIFRAELDAVIDVARRK